MKELQIALFNKLIGSGWEDSLRFFLNSGDFLEILEKLEYEAKEGRRFTPAVRDWLKPFELCPLNRLKVIFLVPKPYLDPTHNSGLAISCKETPRVTIELFRFQEELAKQYPGHSLKGGDLSYLASQGVLLLNKSITAQIGKSGQHEQIWAGFFHYLMDILSRKKDLLFVSFGETGIEDLIGESNSLITLDKLPDHQDIKWESDKLFLKINEFLKNKGINELIW